MNRKLRYLNLAFLMMLTFSMACNQINIVDMPLEFDEERKQLSIEYLKDRHGIEQDHPYIKPTMVVVHWTAIPTLEGTFKAFEKSTLPESRAPLLGASRLNVSAHFVVDRDGTIYRLLPDTVFARHCIGLNYCAIGIENIGDGKDHPLTEAQLASNIALVKDLHNKHAIEYLIGHHEYQRFRQHEIWKETDPNYLTFKVDPGDEFMQKMRKGLAKLELKGAP